MSRITGAKFGNLVTNRPISSTASTSTEANSLQVPKGKMTWEEKHASKFQVEGPAFFEFLKGLGYQPPRHQQVEHLEYLFEHPTSANIVRKLMSNLKPHHGLAPEENDSFETLQKEGLAIYGSDLEEAISRRRAINDMQSKSVFKRLAQKGELETELRLQEVELKRLRQLEEAFEQQLLDREAQDKSDSQMAGTLLNLVNAKEMEIEIDLKLLKEKMAEMNSFVGQLKNTTQEKGPTSICQIEGRRLLENEERLFSLIQEMIKKHGTNLIMKDAGYGVETEVLSVENIQNVFAQFEAELERLKHTIIFEKVEQLSMEMDFAGQEGLRDNYQDCYTKSGQLSEMDGEERSKFLKECLGALSNMEAECNKEHEYLLDYARKTTLNAVNGVFSGLTNIKTQSKKKLHNFFMAAATSLKAQQVRISIIRNLVKAEGKLYKRLLSNIEANLATSSGFSKKALKTESTKVSDLTEDGQMLHSLMGHFGVSNPMDTVASVPKTLTLARKASWELRNQHWNSIEECQSQCQARWKRLQKLPELMQNSSKYTAEDGLGMRIKELEENIKMKEEHLKSLQQYNAPHSMELERQSKENKQKCEEILRLHRNKVSGRK